MDLSFIKEQLETFSTFAGAIGDFLQLPAQILSNIFGWFGDGFTTETGANAKTHIFDNDWDLTSSKLGSSADTTGADTGLSSEGNTDAESGLSSENTKSE